MLQSVFLYTFQISEAADNRQQFLRAFCARSSGSVFFTLLAFPNDVMWHTLELSFVSAAVPHRFLTCFPTICLQAETQNDCHAVFSFDFRL